MRLAYRVMFLPAVLWACLGACLDAAPARWARAGEMEGAVEFKLSPSEPWQFAVRNTPLPQSSRLRTAGGRLETELDDGSMLRLARTALAGLSDYTALSNGQRITLLSLEAGLFYFTGRPQAREMLSLAMPGAQVIFTQRARIRSEITASETEVAVLEGTVRFSTASAELELREGQTVRVPRNSTGRFQLLREIAVLPEDEWSEKLDRAQEQVSSLGHLPGVFFRNSDLQHFGKWIQTEDHGAVWRPEVQEEWAPFQSGSWRWYDELGFTWIAAESWGFVPYHYGRWLQDGTLGWVWVPGSSSAFDPGPVYWLKANQLLLWGALAPGEAWSGQKHTRQFARRNTTAGHLDSRSRAIELVPPAAKPKDLVASAEAILVPPSPQLPTLRSNTPEPTLPVQWFNVLSFASIPAAQPAVVSRKETVHDPVEKPKDPLPTPKSSLVTGERPAERFLPAVYVEPVEIFYPVPVYSGVLVLNPAVSDGRKPGKKDSTKEERNASFAPKLP